MKMNLIEKLKTLKNTKGIKNLNELARADQKKIALIVVAAVVGLLLVGWLCMRSGESKKTQETTEEKNAQMAGTTDAQFTETASQKAIEEQQRQIKELNEQLTAVSDEMAGLQKALEAKQESEINSEQSAVQELQTRIAELEDVINKRGGNQASQANPGLENGLRADAATRGITTTSFSYDERNESGEKSEGQSTASEIKTAKNYVPPGTFAQAVLLSGADTNAGVNGQADTTPITMRVLDNGVLPNGERSSLKGCFVTAAAYGDASSERGQIRLQRLSCVRQPSGQILDIAIEGTINDMGGSDGVRGHVVMRNHKLIWNAGISGVLSGFGSAMQQSVTTQAISPLGVTNALKSGKAGEYGVYNGANTALGKLADYYIKLADMYHPIVQLHAGSKVNIVFLKGFFLTEGLANSGMVGGDGKTEKPQETANVQNGVPENLMQTIRNSQLGDGVNDTKNASSSEAGAM